VAHRGVIGDDRRGPVAEASTREQCIALYPGSKSRPGLQPSLLRSFGSAISRLRCSKLRRGKARLAGLPAEAFVGGWLAEPKLRSSEGWRPAWI